MNEVIIIAGMAFVTLVVRYPVLAMVGRISMPPALFRALNYVPPAVLTAIIVQAVLFKEERLAITPTNDYLVAGIISTVVAWRSRFLLLTILVGMLALLAWRWLLSMHVLGI